MKLSKYDMKKTILLLIFLIAIFSIILFYSKNLLKKNNYYFTFIVLPDTQKYTMYHPDIFKNQTEWIVKNVKKLNIKFVSHLGDIVQSGSLNKNEWIIASKALSLLENNNIPYSLIPGNHDVDIVDNPDAKFSTYNHFFPVNRFIKKPWFGGNYKNYQNNYQLITIENYQFIILNLEVDPTNDILEWASQILNKYKNKYAIITTHAYLNDNGERLKKPHFRKNGNSGEQIWDKLIKNHCNIFLVISGHAHSIDGENHLISINNCNKKAIQIVQDFQDREKGGNGLLRIYKFYPIKKKLYIETYSTTSNYYEKDKNSKLTFNLPF